MDNEGVHDKRGLALVQKIINRDDDKEILTNDLQDMIVMFTSKRLLI